MSAAFAALLALRSVFRAVFVAVDTPFAAVFVAVDIVRAAVRVAPLTAPLTIFLTGEARGLRLMPCALSSALTASDNSSTRFVSCLTSDAE